MTQWKKLAIVAGAMIAAASAAHARDCSVTSTGFTPLLDLAGGAYDGAEGGLYPGGQNEIPAGHRQAGLAIARQIAPLDALGAIDAEDGRVVVGVLGFSNAALEAAPLVLAVQNDPLRAASIDLVNCAASGRTADRIADPGSPYWQLVSDSLAAAGYTAAQLQIVLLKLTIANPGLPFTEFTTTLADYGETIVGIIKALFPNVRIIHLWSRSYAGYAGYPVPLDSLNPEPWAYWTGFAVKQLIARQIAGDPALDYDLGECDTGNAPWLGWGAYLWADGLAPRSDSLTWECDDFGGDGVHPSPAGCAKAAGAWLQFLHGGDPVASQWYSTEWSAPLPGEPGDSDGSLVGTLYAVTGRARSTPLCAREEELVNGTVLRRPDLPQGMYYLRSSRPGVPVRKILVVR